MKFGLVVVGIILSYLCIPAMATTLKLSPEIKILVVDGKKVSNNLLKGSTGLELAGNEHQILLRVEKVIKSGSRDEELYTSPPLIITFNAPHTKTVSFNIPKLSNEQESLKFNREPTVNLYDEHGNPISSTIDILKIEGLAILANLEKEMARYNRENNVASLPTLTLQNELPALSQNNSIEQTTVVVKGENVAEQMLQYWYQQADKQTKQRFMKWANEHNK